MKNRILASILVVLSLALILTACGSSGGGGGAKALGEVSALYSTNGADWNDYVRGGNIINATDVACDPDTDTACVHAGEVRVIELANITDCTGITAADEIGAFDWTCDDSSGTATLISNGLASGSGLASLIDFTTPGWKDNSLTVRKGGKVYGISNSSAWWDNAVIANTTGGDLGEEGTVYIVPTDTTAAYDLMANSVSLVTAPGVVITGPGTTGNVIASDGSVNARDFLWIEGTVDAAGDNRGVYLKTVRFSTLRNLTAENADSGSMPTGIWMLLASGNTLSGITANSNSDLGFLLYSCSNNNLSDIFTGNSSTGIQLTASHNNTLSEITATNNTSNGIYLVDGSSGNTFSGVTATKNTNSGIHISTSSDNNTLSGISASNNNTGINLSSSSGNTLSGVTATNNTNYGVYLWDSSGNTLSGISASNNNSGVCLWGSSDNTLSGITASNNGTNGVYLKSSSGGNTLSGVTANNSVNHGVLISDSTNNKLSDVTASNNGIHGVVLSASSSGNTLSGVTASNNTNNGVYLSSSSDGTTLSGITASNNNFGVYLSSSSGNTLSGVTASNNGFRGVYLLNSSNNYFTSALQVGDNGMDCYIQNTVAVTSPGLDDDNTPGDVETDTVHDGLCIQQGASDFVTAVTGITLASSFVGKVTTEDTVNTSDTTGAASMTNALSFDWVNFENIYRAWGRDGNAFPDATNRGRLGCSDAAYTNQTDCEANSATWTGEAQIWDWSLYASDTFLVNSLSYPDTGDIANTLTHWWSGTPGTSDNAGCEAMVTGSLWNTDHCESTFLRSAVEIAGGLTGNDNTLCETGETCLYTPNMGSYQGHGNLISAGGFTDGIITGVTLKEYDTNGY